ncbi:MAG TPA: RNA polymerase sigma factor [Candidatus Acidoferrales bacterium]|jgi:RNA polymerase sigma-70 factor (ECF subfamily)|nr:RNA polymerase sigma factor [Candidatus Acidoferrales bacterium]
MASPACVTSAIDEVYRAEWGRIVATLIRLFSDFDLAEECAQEAFAAAVDQWRDAGIPDSPRAWIIQTAKHKAIDRIRRRGLYAEKLESYVVSGFVRAAEEPDYDNDEISDDLLRLIFTCCHPALAPEAQIALTLRTLCGLETEEIARAFLVSPTTMAQRLVRAKNKIREAGIPYVVPGSNDIAARLDAVLTVIYLVFNEGYAATRGESLVRTDLCSEAIRLGRLILAQMGPQPPSEARALLALMLLHDARRDARLDDTGEIVTLEDQDRTRWNRQHINEALLFMQDSPDAALGPFALQAAIVAVHCKAPRAADTDWAEIVRLYTQLLRVQPSPIVSLNCAVAIAMAEGPRAGLSAIDELAAADNLKDYHLMHAARADLLRRLGMHAEAAENYSRALKLATNESERRFLERRLREVLSAAG